MDSSAQENQNLQPQIQRASPKVISWSKVIVTIVVIVVTTAILGAIYYFFILDKLDFNPPETIRTTTPSAQPATPSSKKDETEDWNVYKDDKITFRYPKDWKRYDSLGKPSFSEKDPSSVYPGVIVPTVAIDSTPDLSLSVYGVDITGLLNSKIGATWNSGAKHYEKLSNLLIDNHKAVWIRQSLNPDVPASGPAIDHVYIQKDNKVYEISLWTEGKGELNKYSDIFNQILSTFKFL